MAIRQSVLFVCLGNICRSPTAHAIFEQKVQINELSQYIYVDSAGTSAFHEDALPDERSMQEAKKQGVDMSYLRARQVCKSDFTDFDWIIAMDSNNYANLLKMKPHNSSAKLALMLDYSRDYKGQSVEDPYYGGSDGFRRVFNQISQACDGLLKEVAEHI